MKHTGSVALSIIITALLLVANTSYWYNREILDGPQFVSTFSQGLLDEDSKEAIATEVVDRGLASRPLIKLAFGKIGKSAVYSLLSNQYFQSELHTVATRAHKRITSPTDPELGINIVALKEYVLPLIGLVRPDLTQNLNIQELPDRVVLIPSKDIPQLYRYTAPILWTGWISFILVLLLSLYYFHKNHDTEYSLRILGVSLIFGSLLVISAAVTMQPLLTGTIQNTNVKTIVENITLLFVTTYVLQVFVLFFIGILMASSGFVIQFFVERHHKHSGHRK